jgi:hypothetical protein
MNDPSGDPGAKKSCKKGWTCGVNPLLCCALFFDFVRTTDKRSIEVKMHMRSPAFRALFSVGLLAAWVPARAVSIVEESFSYAVTSAVSGANGGSGWSGSWSGNNDITSPGLTYGAVVSSGNKLTTDGGQTSLGGSPEESFRSLPTAGTNFTLWIGFLASKASGVEAATFASLALFDNTTEKFNIGKNFGSSFWGFEWIGEGAANTASNFTTDTAFILARVDLNSTSNGVYMWVNRSTTVEPDINDSDAFLQGGPDFTFNRVSIASGGTTGNVRANFDEIRIGTTFFDVVPEPSTWALLTVCGGFVACTRMVRRRRAPEASSR